MKTLCRTAFCAGLALAGLAGTAVLAGPPLPEGWRSWPHVKSMAILPGHPLHESFGGIHHVYVNPEGLAALKSRDFADGTTLIFDLLEAVEDREGGSLTEGARKVTAVMQKDAARWPETGGWGFEAYAEGDPARPLVGEGAAEACFACHQQVAEDGHVFSHWRD